MMKEYRLKFSNLLSEADKRYNKLSTKAKIEMDTLVKIHDMKINTEEFESHANTLKALFKGSYKTDSVGFVINSYMADYSGCSACEAKIISQAAFVKVHPNNAFDYTEGEKTETVIIESFSKELPVTIIDYLRDRGYKEIEVFWPVNKVFQSEKRTLNQVTEDDEDNNQLWYLFFFFVLIFFFVFLLSLIRSDVEATSKK